MKLREYVINWQENDQWLEGIRNKVSYALKLNDSDIYQGMMGHCNKMLEQLTIQDHLKSKALAIVDRNIK